MCGIVGYVGSPAGHPAAARGPGPARAPRLRLGRARAARAAPASRSPSGPAGCATSPTGCPSGSPARSASGTPAGPPTARPTTSTRTRTPTPRAWSPSSTTASSTTPRRCGSGWPTTGVDLVSDTDTEVLAHLVARSERRHPRGQGRRGARPRSRAPTASPSLHADFPDRIVVARNGSPLLDRRRREGDVRRLRPGRDRPAHHDGRPPRRRRDRHGHGRRLHDVPARPATASPRTARRPSTSTRRRTTPATTSPSCTRRCSSSRPRPSGCCAAGSTSGSAPRTSAGSTWTPARPGRSAGSRSSAAARRTTSARWAPRSIEELARIPADAEAASEFRYRNPVIEPDTLYVAVSQSGETIDTLLAVQEIRRKGGRVIGLVNVVGSAIARECDGGIYLHAGPEVAVASTKALTNMFLGLRAAGPPARPGARPVDRRRPPADRRA